MKFKNLLLFFFLLTIPIWALIGCKVQYRDINSYSNLSKSAMYYDFDSLMNIVKEVNPQIKFRDISTGTNTLKSMQALRKEIDTCSSRVSFLNLLNEVMTLNQDGHSSILPLIYFDNSEWIRSSSLESIEKKSITLSFEYTKYIEKIKNSSKINLPIAYQDGKYYFLNSFEYKGILFKKGFELKKVNGIAIDDYVNELSKYKALRWDIEKKKFYDENFYKNLKDLKVGRMGLLIQNQKGEELQAYFNLKDSIQVLGEKLKLSDMPSVNYDNSRKSIHIRIPKMNIADTTYYIAEIRKLSKKQVDSVFIDIRGNRGGSDLVGERVLQNIISDAINYELKVICKPSKHLAKFLNLTESDMQEIELDYLKGSKFWILESSTNILYPDKKSINYKGKIFIIIDENIFSAAGTLSAYANYTDRIVTVGRKTGKLLGRGTTPIVFSLPNSHLLIRIEPVLDIGNAKNIEEIYD